MLINFVGVYVVAKNGRGVEVEVTTTRFSVQGAHAAMLEGYQFKLIKYLD